MSRDAYIYLKEEAFPEEELNFILSEFNSEYRGDYRWVLSTEDGPIFIEALKLSENDLHSGKFAWRISLHYQAGYGPRKLWLAYVVPYHCLVQIQGSSYYCPQQSILIGNAEDFEGFANKDILNLTSLQKLHKHGLLTENERLKINT